MRTFAFDRYGNRNFVTSSGATTTLPESFDPDIYNPTVNASNNKFNTGQDWSYDAAGNVIGDPEGRSFTYDAENKQVEVRNSSNAAIGKYWYDGDGKRVKKEVPGTGEVTVFVYDAAGKQIAEYSTVVASANDAKVAYLTADHLGSPRINTDVTGAVTSRHDYHPFGEEIATSQRTTTIGYADDTVRKQFTGHERDDESGLDFAQARMYAGGHGRFSTPDPYNVILEKERGKDEDERAEILVVFISNPQRWNMYVYVVNNPLAFTDPDGHTPRTINVFIQEDVISKEDLEKWKKWAASVKGLTVNIYVMNKDTPGTVNAFLDSLKAKDTATIFMGHSYHSANQMGIAISGSQIGNSQDQKERNVSHTADGIDIQNTVVAIFSCGFGKGFDNLTSTAGTAFVWIDQGQAKGAHKTTYAPATNAAAFLFAKSIAKGSWSTLEITKELKDATDQGQSGIYAYPHPQFREVNAGDRVKSRTLLPPRKK